MSTSSSPLFEAYQLSLPKPLHTPSPQISSFLYDPFSATLALRHTDSSFSLYPSFSPLSLSSLPSPKSLVPSPTSSAAFLHLRTTSNSSAATTTLFLTSSPLLRPTSSTLIRFYILRDGRFGRIGVVSNHRDLEFDRSKCGVVFKVNHGVSMALSGGINVFTLYSVSSSKIWLFAARLIADDEGGGGEALKLMKCAVIDCCSPVFTIRVMFRVLILGEENGVRIFPLQPLVRGIHRKEKKNNGKRYNSKNVLPKGEKTEKHSDSEKLRSVKLRQDSRDVGAFYVPFEDNKDEERVGRSVKAISIEALSSNCFVVLDNVGDVHLLSLSYSVQGLNNRCLMKRSTQTMKVVKLSVFHDASTVTRTIWMSDGCHSVHLMMVSDMDTSPDKTEKKDTTEKLIQTSVTQAIFASEKIQDIVPLAANAVLILGQGSMFAYTIS
ncbi:hypothetical protein ABFS82_08G072900 [Erythranthe guttata]|uniref:uncharacterized protein LOC105974374 isoform X1 n=1 Tax=Erythranthe guttata TaxID=4155 RepID=UPI00064D8DF2|nr:PREDICTED: uncharacterized protein LOC105974374 isoform X1 [Erythranthe guttata]|eukprot:XP_012854920.1 PREDICTED: uncharacterized protein LOC105974374 isoform X1 [Erythranthe guttata]